MKYGFVLPHGDARIAADFARDAEQAGWDGFFVWEPVWGYDAWVLLAAAAMQTSRIKLGTMISPMSRMRPWKLAGETVTVDHLSNGRVIFSVGMGAVDTGFAAFGEETDLRTRAELLDEGLDILEGLWKGQPFKYEGKHYKLKPTDFVHNPPPPVQQPRIPIWVVGAWPRPKSMRRVARCDGMLVGQIKEDDGTWRKQTFDDIRAIKDYLDENRTLSTPFDLVWEGEETPGEDPVRAAEMVAPWADAGITWWIESRWMVPSDAEGLAQVRERILQGPPRI